MPDWSFMSFSGEVKKELLAHVSPDRHCQLAEIAAMISGAGSIRRRDGRIHISFVTENKSVADKYVRLLSAAAGITACVSRAPHTQQKHKHSYLVSLSEEADVRNLFVLLKIMDSRGTLREQLQRTIGRHNGCHKNRRLSPGIFTGRLSYGRFHE